MFLAENRGHVRRQQKTRADLGFWQNTRVMIAENKVKPGALKVLEKVGCGG